MPGTPARLINFSRTAASTPAIISSRTTPAPPLQFCSNQRTGAVLTAGILVTVVVFLLPSHGVIGRPLIWLSTLMHELGHHLGYEEDDLDRLGLA